jgi:hypothetical protein
MAIAWVLHDHGSLAGLYYAPTGRVATGAIPADHGGSPRWNGHPAAPKRADFDNGYSLRRKIKIS